MSEIIDTVDRDNSLKTVGHISYLLHTVVAVAAVLPGAQASVALLLVAVVIAGILYLLTAPLWLLFVAPGWIAWTGVSLWFLYRVIRGWLNLNGNRPMPQ